MPDPVQPSLSGTAGPGFERTGSRQRNERILYQLPHSTRDTSSNGGCYHQNWGKPPTKRRGHRSTPEGGSGYPRGGARRLPRPSDARKQNKNEKTKFTSPSYGGRPGLLGSHPIQASNVPLTVDNAGPLREPPHTGKQRPSYGGQDRAS